MHRNKTEQNNIFLISIPFWMISIFIVTIIALLLYNSLWFLSEVGFFNFFFGMEWDISSKKFGIIPLITGTFLIAILSVLISLIFSLPCAIYIAEYSKSKTLPRIVQMMATIPTVVYGYVAVMYICHGVTSIFSGMNMDASSESALSIALTIGVMITPFLTSLIYDALKAVPVALRMASYALGADRESTIIDVVLKAAMPSMLNAVLIASSRAIGETIIVTMAAGLTPNLTANPLVSVTTITAQIFTIITGDLDIESLQTKAAYAIALFLVVVTYGINVCAARFVSVKN